ncbi:MAG: crossover junction endodeoxyribonuclease RuvC [Alphaproteobacteria bacterium]|nr:MAG: crossover junction endodeoxyribonuclease RuvC [Alphaproteobacteria bacterium]
MRILGLDPGLRKTGWGVIEVEGARLSHVANGVVTSTQSLSLAERLVELYDGLSEVLTSFAPAEAAVEETFVNKDARATLKLGQARAMSLLVPARAGLRVFEYAPNLVKKSVVGSGHAGKDQIAMMVGVLLPKAEIVGPDAADALAVAITHAHHRH